jgi:3-hydroxy-9,10-secoandrosta-1,3,5(10)-triene-9,17-dione monooxygenase reductase component
LIEKEQNIAIGEALRHGMGRFATGVTLVTTRDAAGRPAGTTANAVTSLSLDPPLLLVCLARTSLTLAAIAGSGHFAVNVLGARHRDAARSFARRGSDGAWETVAHRAGHTGSPRVEGAITVLDCAVEQVLPGGDHEIVVGRVLDVETGASDDEPLLFFRGAYAALPGAPAEPVLVECDLPTLHGGFHAVAQATAGDGAVTVALVHGDPAAHPHPLVRSHAACLFGDALGSLLCDCRARLDAALEAIAGAGAGVLLYTKPPSTALPVCGRDRPSDHGAGDGLLRHVGLTSPFNAS